MDNFRALQLQLGLKRIKIRLLLNCFVILLSFTSCTNSSLSEEARINRTGTKLIIDGSANDLAWQEVAWRNMNQKWLGEDFSSADFSGKYKLLWDKDHLYVLAEIVDDKLTDIHPNGLDKYWDDDCLEVFIDEDASGGDHQYNYNAFAYHIALDNRVTDIGVDSLPHYYDHIECRRITENNRSVWEIAIDIYADSFTLEGRQNKVVLTAQKEIGFAIAYCDNDNSNERENFIGSVGVEGDDKNRAWIDAGIFEKMVLAK